ncbi:hypothetical protein Ddc_15905 [Ditylenchus destructor]|nr:hypothetical protein Ddc_15905 [Ditylenchus destructor]
MIISIVHFRYGCYACLTFVQYLDNNFKIGVRQIDDKNTTLGTTCPSTLDDPECPENNVGRLIRKCERALPPNFTPQQFCDYACWYCNELVEYLYKVHENDEHNVLPNQVDDKNETLGELVCPLNESNCVKNNVEPLLERCIKNVASSSKSKESGPIFCSKMNETVRCIHKHLDAVCGYESSVNETLTNAVPAIARKYCAYCHGPAVYMEELGAHLRLNDSNRAEDYCGIEFCDISLLEQMTKKFQPRNDQKSDDVCSQKYNATKNTYNTVNQLCGEEFAKEYMRDHYVVKVAMFKYVECIYENVTAVCGEEIAEKHMTRIRPETPSKNCPDCYNATDFMEKHDGHLYIKKSLADEIVYTKPYCVEPVCEKNALESTVIQTCKIEPQNTPQDTCR